MLCPICLDEVQFLKDAKVGYSCPNCKDPVPAMYPAGYSQYPPSVFSSVGFRGHGKTVYLASLFHVLAHLELPRHWRDYYKTAAGDRSQEIVDANVEMLKRGRLPDSTAQNFPKPTLVQLKGIPARNGTTLLCYDAAGESFEKAARMVNYARFFARSNAVLLLVSVPDLEREGLEPAREMERLLAVYRNGIAELGGTTRTQRLVVVYTKADEWRVLDRPQYRGLRDHLAAGTFDGLADYRAYRNSLRTVSGQLRGLTEGHLRAQGFLSNIKDNFAGAEFCVVSALGASARGQQLETAIAPRRVLDPLLWVLDRNLTSQRRSWRGVFRRFRGGNG